MFTINRQSVSYSFKAAIIGLAMMPMIQAQEKSNGQVVESLLANLTIVSVSKESTTAAQTDAVLNRLRTELSEQAIGVILSKELQLDRLASELRQEDPNAMTLRSIERSLRRILPGRIQGTVNELRTCVAELAQLVSSTPSDLDEARRAIAIVNDHFHDEQLRRTNLGESELRAAFRTLTELHPSAADVEELRQRLSFANYGSLIKSDFLTTVSKRSFELPIDIRECKDGTSIVGTGKFKVALSLELPRSLGESHLLVHATGTGQIDARADRGQIHVRARVSPKIQGTQTLHVRPAEVSGDAPVLAAQLSTRLTSIHMDGPLGRCELIEKVASRAVQKRLTANDKLLSDQIERTAGDRIEEEGFDLAYRVNGLLRHGVWDRIESLDFTPNVRLQNDSQGIRSDIDYSRKNQLGAMSPRPEIPPEVYPGLDLITWIHESVANNALDSLTGLRLDEATVRSLWQVEFKLTSDDWEKIQPAKTPAVITLADQSPLTLRFLPHGIEMLLRATACEIDGQVQDVETCEIRIHYNLDNDADGIRFTRQEIDFLGTIPVDEVSTWSKALDRFFAKTIRPLPKFRKAGFSSLLRLGYLNSNQGWLVVGATRVSPSTSPSTQLPEEISR